MARRHTQLFVSIVDSFLVQNFTHSVIGRYQLNGTDFNFIQWKFGCEKFYIVICNITLDLHFANNAQYA